MPQCFGGVTHYIPPEQEEQYAHAINHFAAGYASDSYFQGEVEAGSIIPGDTIEDLAKAVDIPADALKETCLLYTSFLTQQPAWGIVGVLGAAVLFSCMHVVLEWERTVVPRFGKFNRVAGPGLIFMIPFVEYSAATVDLRMRCLLYTSTRQA